MFLFCDISSSSKTTNDNIFINLLTSLSVIKEGQFDRVQEDELQKDANGDHDNSKGDSTDCYSVDSRRNANNLSAADRKKRAKYYDDIAIEVEQWAEQLLSEDHSNSNKNNNSNNNNGKNRGRGQHQQEQEHNQDDNNGTWREIMCHSFLRKMYNQNGTTKCYLKWMKDSRGKSVPPAATTNAKSNHKKNNNNNKKNNSNRLYPCIIVFSTLDAPMDDVCAYLSDETRIPEYNEVVVKNLDLEHISPHSKICWGQSPQILFVKPRDFVTFCHHRWRKDGTQIVVNQAVNQDEYDFDASCFSDSHHNKGGPIEEDEEDNGNGNNNSGKPLPRAYALRGANFISPHPDDPKKTSFIFICHANPGGNIPQWASRTAVNAVAPIEPFKMIYRVNEGVKRSGRKIATQLAADARKNNNKKGRKNTNRSSKPAGLAQMGYACFWPNGGGKIE